MTKRQSAVGSGMRPNIRITHSLNGRVKDYANEQDMDVSEAYEQIIVTGLAELEGDDE